jgi:hypothetical protein
MSIISPILLLRDPTFVVPELMRGVLPFNDVVFDNYRCAEESAPLLIRPERDTMQKPKINIGKRRKEANDSWSFI